METEDLAGILQTTSEGSPPPKPPVPPLPQSKPQDNPPPTNVGEPQLDEDRLGRYLVQLLTDYVTDKEMMGWDEKRQYDLKSYYGVRDEVLGSWPWPNASNHPVSITPVLLEVGWSAINDLLWRDPNNVVRVTGIGEEDIKNAKKLSAIMNQQVINGIPNSKRETFATTFQMLLHGTSYKKVVRQVDPQGNFAMASETVPIERIYLAIDAKSPQINECECVIQIIPLSANDMRQRVAWGVYKNLDKVPLGWSIANANNPQKMALIKQQITGLDITRRIVRDMRFIGEAYITYYPENSVKARELIVWFAPASGAILRVVDNVDNMRPFSDWYCYPNHGMAYHRSLPEIIRNVQEKATYTDKQLTDARDKAISPAGFYDGTSGFDPNTSLRIPTGMYPVKNIGSIQWEPINIAPIMEAKQEVKDLWLEAERITGFSDLWQGINSGATRTLGQDVMRSKKSDLRFTTIKEYVNDAWKKDNNLVYAYINKYLPRKTKVKILGATEFASIDEMFPLPDNSDASAEGLQVTGEYDFAIANKSIDDQQQEDQNNSMLASLLLGDGRVVSDPGNWYRAWKLKADSVGYRDFGELIKKPKEADVLTPDEVINRLMDGEKGLVPSIYADPADYEERIRIYMRSGNFREADPAIQFEFDGFLKKVVAIRIGKQMALEHMTQIQAQGMMGGVPPIGGGQPGTPPPSLTPVIQRETQNVPGVPNPQ